MLYVGKPRTKTCLEVDLSVLKCFGHYSSWYKSRLKNIQAIKRRIQNFSSSIERREGSTDQTANLQNFKECPTARETFIV